MKKMLILLLAILAIVMVAYFCIYEKRIPFIEKDLSFRSQDKLNSQDMSWARVEIDGRNLTLTGVAPSEAMREEAVHTANVKGVNFVDNKLLVAGQEDNKDTVVSSDGNNKVSGDYSLDISKNKDGKFIIEGVMSAAMHQKVMAEAAAKLGVDQLIDRIVDKEIEMPKELPKIAMTMLTRVIALEDGKANLTGKKLVVSGSTPTTEAIEQIKQKTAEGLPKGFVSSFNLTPPAAITAVDKSANLAEKKTVSTKKKSSQISSKKCQKKFNNVLAKSKIHFNSSSAVIKKSSYTALNKLAGIASECTSHSINVHGHTDTTGRNQLNQRLSKKRAQAVANYLAKKGVSQKHVRSIGHGSSKPIASNDTSAGRARNRRIELTIED